MTANKWFLSFLKKYKWNMAFGLLLTTLISVLAIVNPYISGLIVDDVIIGGEFSLLPKLILTLLTVTAVRGILRFYYQVIFETCSQGVLYEMRDKVYRKLLQEDFAFYNKKRTGDLMSRQTGDMDAIRHFVAYVIYSVYRRRKACALYAGSAPFYRACHLSAVQGGQTRFSEKPQLFFFLKCLCAGKCQR